MNIDLISLIKCRIIKLSGLLVLVSLFSFILVNNSPVDPVKAYVGADMMLIGPEQKVLISKRWGLDQPVHIRFLKWGGQVLSGNFGISVIYNEPVTRVIAKRFYTSLKLMAVAWTLSGILGFIMGLISGVFKGSPVDKLIRLYAYTMASTPAFWMGIVLLMFFSVKLGWTPVCGSVPPGSDPSQVTLLGQLHHLILPAFTLSVIGVANIALHTREKVVEVMQSDFVLYARAQGEKTSGIIFYHTIRNAALPAITLQFASLGELFGGSVLTEQVFSYPGLGKATIEAGIGGDVPLLLGIVLFSTLFVYSGNAIADVIYRIIDPRIRNGSAGGGYYVY